MYSFIYQIILAARNRDDEGGWIQILVFVGMATFWIVGGIAKAKANKIKEGDFEAEEPKDKPKAGQRREIQAKQFKPIPAKPKPRIQQLDKSRRMQQPLTQAIDFDEETVKIKSADIEAEKKEGPEISIEDKLKELKKKALSKKKPVSTERKTPFLFEFDDPDELKKAILHYEILGKPISLRDI